MERKGVDVSYAQGRIDWKKFKKTGCFAIIRAGYGKNHLDNWFRINAKGAADAGVDVGFYWFSYAQTAAEGKAEAEYFVKAVESMGVKPTYPMFFDYEYDSEKKCPPKVSITAIAEAFLKRVKELGYYPAIYANPDYLNRGFAALTGRYDLWLAHWGVSKPSRACGMWQYGSAKYSGISGNVDADIAYKDYPRILVKQTAQTAKTDQISDILSAFAYYIGHGGYREKRNGAAAYLTRAISNFAANAGSANWTYMGKLCGVNPGAWCAMMVSTAVYEGLGNSKAAAKAAMWGVWPYTCCNQLWDAADDDHRHWGWYSRWKRGRGDRVDYTPRVGDVIIFTDNGTSRDHTGMVYAVDADNVYTYEGNSGNMARKRVYPLKSSYIYGYVTLNVTGTGDNEQKPDAQPEDSSVVKNIKAFQKWLGVDADGVYGPKTKAAAIKAHQRYLNSKYKAGLAVDGVWGPLTYYATETLRKGDESNDVLIWQGLLYCNGYDPVGLDGTYSTNTFKATVAMQNKVKLNPTGNADRYTWARMFGCGKPNHTMLRRGSKGAEVKYLQRRLTNAGYATPITGKYDAKTEQAVKAYQKANGLTVDGICGPKTWAKIN